MKPLKELPQNDIDFIRGFCKLVANHKPSNHAFAHALELIQDESNIMTPSNYSKKYGMSYPGVVKSKNIDVFFGAKLVIE